MSSAPVFTSKFHFQEHDGQLTRVLDQPTRGLILERNAELRKNPGAILDLGSQSGGTFGRQIASIPEITFYEAMAAGYDLMSKDKETSAREMNRFLRSPEGKACLVQGK
jgi:hypothetical protein